MERLFPLTLVLVVYKAGITLALKIQYVALYFRILDVFLMASFARIRDKNTFLWNALFRVIGKKATLAIIFITLCTFTTDIIFIIQFQAISDATFALRSQIYSIFDAKSFVSCIQSPCKQLQQEDFDYIWKDL